MGNALLAPAHWALARLGSAAAFALGAALSMAPALVALFAHDALPRHQLAWLVGALCVLSLYALAALRTFVSMDITQVIRVTDRLASGELMDNVRGTQAGTRDAARLWESIQKMNGTLVQIVRQVRASAEAVVSGAQTIADGNAQLAQRTEEQAVSLEETASGIQQLASSARQNAEGCERASRLAAESREVATHASGQMRKVADTMRAIDTSARRVAEILGTVEGIAFQTNILALNAAVEAARAGDQGRGFSVVAAEVRQLAHRSAAAAKEIKALIDDSMASVEAGRKWVAAADETMVRVEASVAQVTGELGAIARASREQSAGVEEINNAIAQVDAVTQQNAALVEEAAGAAEAFQQEAARLADVVGRFKTDRNDDRGRVISLVKQAVEHVRRHGVQRACADLNDPHGPFVRGEDYVFALAGNGQQLAYAPDPTIVGRNNVDEKDPTGKVVGREILGVARAPGFGWVDYHFVNPRTQRLEPKSVYVEAVEGIILGCGIYRNAQA